MHNWKLMIALAVYLLALQGPGRAQSNVMSRSEEIRRALQRAEFQIAADLADSAIAHFERFSPAELAEIHTLRALAFSELGQPTIVDAHFLAALQLNAKHKLDPIFFSPAMQQRFEQLRARLPKAETPVRIETRYVMLPDPRIKAAGKSLLIPGWGQRAKGQHQRGTVFTVAAASLAVAVLTTHFLRERARDDYLAADAANVGSRYDTYNRYHLWRNNLALGLGLVWGTSVLDALLLPAHTHLPSTGLGPSGLAPNPAVGVSITIGF